MPSIDENTKHFCSNFIFVCFRKYKLTQSMLASLGPNATEEQKEQVAKIAEAAAQNMNGDIERPASNGSVHSESSNTPPLQLPPSMQPQPHFQPPPPPPVAALSMLPQLRPQLPPGFPFPPHQPLPASGMFGLPPPGPGGPQVPGGGPAQPLLLSEIVRDRVPDDAWQNYMLHFDSGEGCGFQGCEVEDLAHYHCKDDGCEMIFRHEDGVREHGRNHFMQDQISELFFVRGDPEDEPEPECPDSCIHRKAGLHFHCKWVSSPLLFSYKKPKKCLSNSEAFYFRYFSLEGTCILLLKRMHFFVELITSIHKVIVLLLLIVFDKGRISDLNRLLE